MAGFIEFPITTVPINNINISPYLLISESECSMELHDKSVSYRETGNDLSVILITEGRNIQICNLDSA